MTEQTDCIPSALALLRRRIVNTIDPTLPGVGPDCDACARPVGDDARLCAQCTDRLARDIGDIGALAAELDTTRLRQSRMGGAATGILARTSSTPLPWDERAAIAADYLRDIATAWARMAVEDFGRPPPSQTMGSIASTLLGALERFRHHEAAADLADEIHQAVADAWHVIDRRRERTYAGPCRATVVSEDGDWCCTAELHPHTDRPRFRCPACRTDHDLPARKRWLLALAEDQLATVTELCAFVGGHDRPLSRHVVNGWIRRGQLTQRGSSQPALYRIGDVVTLLVNRRDTPTKASARETSDSDVTHSARVAQLRPERDA